MPKRTTRYSVYRVDPDEGTLLLSFQGDAEAHDGRRAVQAVAGAPGEYVAIPERSLTVFTAKTEQPRLTVS